MAEYKKMAEEIITHIPWDGMEFYLYNDVEVKIREMKEGEEVKTNFKHIGYWDENKNIEIVEFSGERYALNGWNGEAWVHCWKVTGERNIEASEEEYEIRPIYSEFDECDCYTILDYELV